MNLRLHKYIFSALVTLMLFNSCKVLRENDKMLYYKSDDNSCPTQLYYGVFYDSVSHYNHFRNFLSSGSTFIRFREDVSRLMKQFSDSLKVNINAENKSVYKLDENVKFNPEKKRGGYISEDKKVSWNIRYRKNELKSVQIEGLPAFKNQTLICSFYFLKVDEGRLHTASEIMGMIRLEVCIIKEKKVQMYKRYLLETFRHYPARLSKGDDLPWFKEKHVYALVAKVFEELKNCSK